MQEPQTRLYNQLLNTAFIRGVRKVIEVINGSTSQKVHIRAHCFFLREWFHRIRKSTSQMTEEKAAYNKGEIYEK